MSRPHRNHDRRRALLAATLFVPVSAAFATTYDLSGQSLNLSTVGYTAADTLTCSNTTFECSAPATLPAALNLVTIFSTTLNNNFDVTFSGPLSGSAPFYKYNVGSLTLTASSPSYTGTPHISGGTVRLNDPLAFGPASAPNPIDFSSAALDLAGSLPARAVRLTNAYLTNTSTSPVTVGPALSIVPASTSFTVNGAGDVTFVSPLPTSSAKLSKDGFNVLTYSTPTAFAGGVAINHGALRLGIEAPFVGSSLVTAAGGTLDLNGFSSPGAPLKVESALVNNNLSAPSIVSTPFTLSQGASFGGAGSLTLATPVPATSSLVKIGTGTLTLAVDNPSFTGWITVNAGSVRLGTAAAAGNGISFPSPLISVATGGQFDLNGFAPPALRFSFDGGALVNDNVSTPVTLSSVSNLFADSAPVTLGGAGEIVANRSLSNVTKSGPGPLTLNLAAGASGSWNVNGGTVRLAKSNAFASGAVVTANVGGALDLNGFPLPAGVPVTLNDGGVVNNNADVPVTLPTAPSFSTTSHNPRFGGDGTLNLTFSSLPVSSTLHKIGAGLMTLPAAGLPAGLTVEGGLVQIEADAQLGNTTAILDGGGIRVGPLNLAPLAKYAFAHNIQINPGGGIVDTEANTVLAGFLTAPLQPAGTLTKTGTANLTLDWSLGNYRYNFPITVNQGTLTLRNSTYNLGQSLVTLNTDDALAGATTFTVGALAGTGALNNRNITTGALNVDTTYAGAFTNGTLTTTGTGSLTLTGPVAATSVTLNSGTLQIGDGHTTGSLSSPTITVAADAQLVFDRSDPVTHTGSIVGTIYGGGTLTKLAGNTLTLTKSSSTLKLDIAAGTLVFAPSLTFTPRPTSLTIAAGASLDLTNNNLILNYTGASPLATLRQYLLSRQLLSSSADADPRHLTTLAYAEASTLLGLTGTQTAYWTGLPVDATTLLVAPALSGDANLDGKIDGGDYALVDRGFARHASIWQEGDFNYDGVIDQNDYLLIDTTLAIQQGGHLSPSFLSQRESQFGADYVDQLLTSVPEPSSAVCLVVGLLPLARRRRPR